eukprot:4356494-Pyramimonas_sp.AAC.1
MWNLGVGHSGSKGSVGVMSAMGILGDVAGDACPSMLRSMRVLLCLGSAVGSCATGGKDVAA